MSGIVLAAVLALATDPRCGAAPVGSELAKHLQATAVHESGDDRTYADPLAIGINADPARGLHAVHLHPETEREAVAEAYALSAQGRSLDLGLMQINLRSLADDGLSIASAFDACRNMAAGAHHFVGDIHTVLNMAHRFYNTGSVDRGAEYADAIQVTLNRIEGQQDGAAATAAPLPPSTPPCAPEWDAWALAQCSAEASSGSSPSGGASSDHSAP